MLCIWLAVAGLLLLGVLYWLLITTEGTYLGSRVVTLLYDWTAGRYDAIKNLHFVNEARYLGLPVAEALPQGAEAGDPLRGEERAPVRDARGPQPLLCAMPHPLEEHEAVPDHPQKSLSLPPI